MINSRNIHLWIIGALSFAGFAFAEMRSTEVDGEETSKENHSEARPSSDSIAQAEQLYLRRCGACHSLDANRIGPRHRDVIGRQAGSLTDYDYSDALKRQTFIWDATHLQQWLANPESLVPGQKMGFRLSDVEERKAIILYLETHSK